MPQPYPKNMQPSIRVVNAATDRPDHYLLGMQVIAAWSNAEMSLQHVFASMLGANPRPAAAVFSSLISNNAQKDALNAVAEQALSKDERGAFAIIMKRHKGAAKNRDCIAHHIWAIDPRMPDAVVLLDPRKYMDVPVSITDIANDLTSLDKIMGGVAQTLREASSIWKTADFIDAHRRIVRVSELLIRFSVVALCRDNDQKRAALLAKLKSEPEFQ